jgi:formylglycine-generating enzyme required for sulfatase activity
VGSFPRGAGPFGTLDQAGNVWEWCEDNWDANAYQAREGAKDPVNNRGDTAVRGLRGGSWGLDAGFLAAAYRIRYGAADRFRYIGFRCVLPSRAEP